MRSLLLAAATLAPWCALPPQARSPVVEGIEVRVMSAPTTGRVDGQTVLVWEVHIANNREDTIQVQRLAVRTSAGADVATYEGAQLESRLQSITRRPLPQDARGLMAPGVRRMLHLWIPLPSSGTLPRDLVHLASFGVAGEQLMVKTRPLSVSAIAPVVIGPPLRGGPWATLYDPFMPGGHRMAAYTVDGNVRIPGRFAIDFVRLPASGVFDNKSRSPDRNGFGDDVLAVADGIVVSAVDDMFDNVDSANAPRRRFPVEQGSGNYVALDIGNGRVAFYEHLKSRSIRVRPGQRVRAGAVIGQLGYSGSSSIGPHLHFHMADAPELLGAEGRPFGISMFHDLGGFESIAAFTGGAHFIDRPGGALARRREMPRANAVVMFR